MLGVGEKQDLARLPVATLCCRIPKGLSEKVFAKSQSKAVTAATGNARGEVALGPGGG